MKIALLRHGKPNLTNWGTTSSKEFSAWIEEYNQAPICDESLPDQGTKQIAESYNSIFCSNLSRSIHSAKLIRPGAEIAESELFCELGLPHGRGRTVKLRPSIWSVFFRILWFTGYSHNTESIGEGKNRLKEAVKLLINEADNSQSVLLVGHNFANRMISKELIRNGWDGPSKPKGGYWGITVYEK